MSNETFTYTNCQKCHTTNKVKSEKIRSAGKSVCGKCGSELPFHGHVSEIDSPGLGKLLGQSTLPVVVDFWAPWCGPCRQFAPTFEKVSDKFAGKVVFSKINTEAHPEISTQLQIRGIPTLVIFKNGKEVQRISGALPADQFERWLLSSV